MRGTPCIRTLDGIPSSPPLIRYSNFGHLVLYYSKVGHPVKERYSKVGHPALERYRKLNKEQTSPQIYKYNSFPRRNPVTVLLSCLVLNDIRDFLKHVNYFKFRGLDSKQVTIKRNWILRLRWNHLNDRNECLVLAKL